MSKLDLQFVLQSLDAIEDECRTGLADPGLDSNDTDARYALDSIARIAKGARQKIQFMANKIGIDSIHAMT